jgi:hypothetical protein
MGQPLSVNLGLAASPDVEDKRLFAEFTRIYNAITAVARALDSYTGALQANPADWPDIGTSEVLLHRLAKIYPIFDSAVLPGAMINVYNVAGVLHARLASAADGTKPARGFSTAAVTLGAVGEVFLFGLNTHISGLTPGTLYYLSSTSLTGQIVPAAPAVVGNLVQPVGFALSDTVLFFNPTLEGIIV